MEKIVTLSLMEIQQCYRFAKRSARSQRPSGFSSEHRNAQAIAVDTLVGKMAEVAVARMLKRDFGLQVKLDFGIYSRGVWDDNDLSINGWEIDIKSTRIGQWFLIEWSKLRFRQQNGDLPHAFIVCRTAWNGRPLGWVTIVGIVSTAKLKEKAKTIRKGEYLPNTQTRLKTDNYAIHFRDLEHDWNKAVPFMLTNKPPRRRTI